MFSLAKQRLNCMQLYKRGYKREQLIILPSQRWNKKNEMKP